MHIVTPTALVPASVSAIPYLVYIMLKCDGRIVAVERLKSTFRSLELLLQSLAGSTWTKSYRGQRIIFDLFWPPVSLQSSMCPIEYGDNQMWRCPSGTIGILNGNYESPWWTLIVMLMLECVLCCFRRLIRCFCFDDDMWLYSVLLSACAGQSNKTWLTELRFNSSIGAYA